METSLTSWIAISFGLLHALEPGHGKTALLTYLASGERSWKEGIVISVTSAITHSLAVFLIAFLSHFLIHHDSIEEAASNIGHILSYASGALICGLGVWVIWKGRTKGSHSHSSCCGCSSHKKDKTKSNFLASGILGIATGIIPCPTVVVAYLTGVSTGNSIAGLQNVVLFAIGMCISLMSVIGFFIFGGSKFIEKFKPKKSYLNWNYVQGVVFICIGIFTATIH